MLRVVKPNPDSPEEQVPESFWNNVTLNGVEYRRHPNGGGLVALTAQVQNTVFLGKNAKVFGNAWVYGNAKVYNNAQVYGYAQVYANAKVYNNDQVFGDAKVYHKEISSGSINV